ncbi:hypothetical protein [Halopiger thermotolerans]
MAVNVSTVDNTTRACVDARADGSDGVRAGGLETVGLADEDEIGFDSGSDRRSTLEHDRAVDGVDPAARMGNRSRRPAMITAFSPSVSRQDRPLLAVGAATATGAGTDTSSTTHTTSDTAAHDGTGGSTTAPGADGGASTLAVAVTGTDTETETATGDGAGTTATRRPSHSFAH